MKSILITFGALLYASQLFAQGTDCSAALPVCGNLELKYNPQGRGINDFANPLNDGGCFTSGGGEHQSAWYKIKIAQGGSLTFVLIPDNPKNDYDFGIWGANKDCDALSSPIRCNTAAEAGDTGLDANSSFTSQGPGTGSNKCAALEVKAGETYYLLIDNASRVGGAPFKLNFGGTAVLGEVINIDFTAKEVECGIVEFQSSSKSCSGEALSHTWEIATQKGQVLHTLTGDKAQTPLLAAGSYQVNLTVKSPSGNTEKKSITLTIKDNVNLKTKNTLICNQLTVQAMANSCQNASFEYEWVVKDKKGKTTFQKKTTQATQTFLLDNGQQTITLNAKSSTGITQSKDTTITLNIPTVQVLQKELVCFDDGLTTTLTASTTAKDNRQATFQWFYSGAVIGTGETLQVNKAGDYSVIAQYEQCQLKGGITVENNCAALIYAPTAFSPNKDGLNDVLKIWGKRFKDLEVQIYDQWGTEIFASLLPDEQGFVTWDGTHKGVELPTGTYILTMKYLDLGTLLVTKKQQGITVVR